MTARLPFPQSRRRRVWLKPLGVTLALSLVTAVAAVWLWLHPPTPLPSDASAAIGGRFNLTDEDGRAFSSDSLAGRPFALYFGFTHCPDVCPTSMSDMARLLEALGPAAAEFRVYFVSVDPERDTPELLRTYTDLFHPRLIGLTGTADEIRHVARLYHAFYAKVPTGAGDYTMDHTATIYLMAPDGRFAGTIAYGESDATALEKLRRLVGRGTGSGGRG
ncbi:MAG: SCO family protein [Alphaproteobacteria bacterium]|nr:MAG: SCO family protein [Alphaproteobacteria bacterium]